MAILVPFSLPSTAMQNTIIFLSLYHINMQLIFHRYLYLFFKSVENELMSGVFMLPIIVFHCLCYLSHYLISLTVPYDSSHRIYLHSCVFVSTSPPLSCVCAAQAATPAQAQYGTLNVAAAPAAHCAALPWCADMRVPRCVSRPWIRGCLAQQLTTSLRILLSCLHYQTL